MVLLLVEVLLVVAMPLPLVVLLLGMLRALSVVEDKMSAG
jgi:hypothetical protein